MKLTAASRIGCDIRPPLKNSLEDVHQAGERRRPSSIIVQGNWRRGNKKMDSRSALLGQQIDRVAQLLMGLEKPLGQTVHQGKKGKQVVDTAAALRRGGFFG